MPSTPNLEIVHVEQNQDGHAVTVSEAFDDFDGALTALLEIDVTAAEVVLTNAQALRHLVIGAIGTAGVPRTISVPDGNQKLYVLINGADAEVTLKTMSGVGVAVAAGETLIGYADGSNVVSLGAAGTAGGGQGAFVARVATTAAGTLASDFEAGDNVDGVTLVADDVILIKDQAAGEENGLYAVQGSGAPARITDLDEGEEVTRGLLVVVLEGTTNAQTLWTLLTAGPYTVDTTPLTFGAVAGGAGGGAPAAGCIHVPYRGCLLQLDADDTGISFAYLVPWDSAVYDTDGIYSGANPTRLTVPAGVTRVRLSTCVELEGDADAGAVYLSFYKNGSGEVVGSGSFHVRQSSTGFTNNIAQFVSPVLNVTPGDYFEVRINQSGLAAVDQLIAGSRTWAAMEIVETSDATALAAGNARRLLDDDTSADGIETDFTLSAEPAGALLVFVDGILQDEDGVSTVTTTLTFTTPPPAGAHVIAYDFGSNNASVVTPYDLGAFIAGSPSAGELVIEFVATRSLSFPDDFAGSQLSARTAATGGTVFDLQRNGSIVGTITVAASGTSGTFATSAGAVSLVTGDRLAIVGPDPADATLADIAITLKGTRTS